MGTPLPSGTVTFLFTDIEGSTRLWEQHPAAMQVAIARHDHLLQIAVLDHGGHLVKQTGDGMHAVFEAATDAVRAAVAAQLALRREPWDGIDKLPVRMALHTGESELRAGDYYGRAVNRVARLMAIASGGQILASLTTAEVVGDRLPENVSMESVGEAHLKDVARPVQVFQILHPAFPDLLALSPGGAQTPNNLPAPTSTFIGRAEELAEVQALLVGSGSEPTAGLAAPRILSLIGPGGTGKTRLSLEAAGQLLDHYPDGVWLTELAPLIQAGQVLPAVAAPLGLQEQPGRPLEARLVEAIGTHRNLLILDNCEHLIDECARLADVLVRSCPHLQILTSSREALGIAGERPVRIRSMAVPTERGDPSLDKLAQFDSIRLFLERAQDVRPELKLSPENAHPIRQICVRLDGIPLAIELAAARSRVLTPQQILDRLDDRFQLLTGGSRTALPRQRTLRALIDWSYDLLSEPEQIVLRRLSVFLDGWTLEAAESVAGAKPVEAMDILEILDQLAGKSLVVTDENEWGMRYRMLETIRQYAQAKLAETREARAVRDRHLKHFVAQSDLGHQALIELRGLERLDRLTPESRNLQQAMAWALEHDLHAALKLAGRYTARWSSILPGAELLRYIQDLIERVESNPAFSGPDADRWALGAGLASTANMNFGLGFNIKALEHAERAIDLARETRDLSTLAWALSIGGSAAGALGDISTAATWFTELGEMIEQIPNRYMQATYLVTGSPYVNEMLAFDMDRMLVGWERGMAMFREGGDTWGLAWGYQMLSRAYQYMGDLDKTGELAARSHVLFKELNNTSFATTSLSIMAEVARLKGELGAATEQYRLLLRPWRDAGNQGALARCFECLAFMAIAQSQAAAADGGLQAKLHAASLLGTAAMIREVHESRMTSLEEPEHEKAVEELEGSLGTEKFQEAFRLGQTWTVTDAIDRACEWHLPVEGPTRLAGS